MSLLTHGLLRTTANLAYAARGPVRLPVLMYHRVLDRSDPLQPGVPDAALADLQFKLLSDLFRVVPMETAIDELHNGRLKPRTLCITFDDGYRDNHDVALPLLRRHGLTATFFVASGFLGQGRMFNDTVLEAVRRLPDGPLDLADWGIEPLQLGDAASRVRAISVITRGIKHNEPHKRQAATEALAALVACPLPEDVMMTPEQVTTLSREGMSIGGHTVNHPILSTVDDATARREIVENRAALTALTGTAPMTFAYPNGKPGADYGPRHAAIVREAGYSSAVSTSYGVGDRDTDRYEYPRVALSKTTYTKVFLQLMRASSYVRHGQC
ncbi:polysaccharide deacetylase family protein [Leptothrix discophora]|uniref:Polysaccharide deacetylase family protein n=1 Tax=Leptothrix discophora TaxID=89 RepID=A0ABT9G0B0_LEPDI|nr:polysaccharide deacetylase family protein [Leptothrix discophora]MDP4299907.1 polysaccharide deacetylase family protein [Leptothrix discophora]